MRITIAIDEDVLQAVKERARDRGVSIGKVLLELARQAPFTGNACACEEWSTSVPCSTQCPGCHS